MRLSLVEIVLFLAAAASLRRRCPAARRRPGRSRRACELDAHARACSTRRSPRATIASTICRHGWTRTVRPPVSYTNALKAKGLRQYRLRGPPSAFQEDHLISLELGGDPVDPRNLWPEPYPRASAVDQIENDLNHRVCTGSLSLADAQRRESALKHSDG